MPKIFISYRRADSKKDAGRIHDRLVQAFGAASVFKDVDDIPPGADFRAVLADAVSQCDVLLALIGPQWLNIRDGQGDRRLDNPGDFVRIEVETALSRQNCTVIPVLLEGAQMPPAHELPGQLAQLAYNNAVIVRDDPDFHRDMDRLIQSLHDLGPRNPAPPSASAVAPATRQPKQAPAPAQKPRNPIIGLVRRVMFLGISIVLVFFMWRAYYAIFFGLTNLAAMVLVTDGDWNEAINYVSDVTGGNATLFLAISLTALFFAIATYRQMLRRFRWLRRITLLGV